MPQCNFCTKQIGPDNKGVSNDIGYTICKECILWAKQAINDPEIADTTVIYLKAYQQNKAFSK